MTATVTHSSVENMSYYIMSRLGNKRHHLPCDRLYLGRGITKMVVERGITEQRMVLHNVSWETYERLLRDHEDAGAPRFAFDRGTLEIMSPLPEHERLNRAIQLLLPVIAEQAGVELYSLGSTTFNREDLQQGFEPGSCFYIQHADLVRGQDRIDLHRDPPPDLVVEIDITHPSLDKLPIYAQIGVPEIWRYDGDAMHILCLDGANYTAMERSRAFGMVTAQALTVLLPASKGSGDIAWLQRARAWVAAL